MQMNEEKYVSPDVMFIVYVMIKTLKKLQTEFLNNKTIEFDVADTKYGISNKA